MSRYLVAILVLGGCSVKNDSSEGGERGACYPNRTCNAGLMCLSGVCVVAPEAGRSPEKGMPASDGSADKTIHVPEKTLQVPDKTADKTAPVHDKTLQVPDKTLQVADKTVPDGSAHDSSGTLDASTPTTSWVTVPAGAFTMGSPIGEPCREPDEHLHSVTLTNAFEMQSTEVTQSQFKALMGYDPTLAVGCSGSCAVQNVSWHEAVAYCNALSAKTGLSQCYTCTGTGVTVLCDVAPTFSGVKIYSCPGYRLPTEAEWEYAYRAGTTTAYYNGTNDPLACSCSPLDKKLDKIGWYCGNWFSGAPSVGLKQPNAWGLFDMAGNVQEWCHDRDPGALSTTSVTNPWGSSAGVGRICRGGSANGDGAQRTRAASRYCRLLPTLKGPALGFRPCRTK